MAPYAKTILGITNALTGRFQYHAKLTNIIVDIKAGKFIKCNLGNAKLNVNLQFRALLGWLQVRGCPGPVMDFSPFSTFLNKQL